MQQRVTSNYLLDKFFSGVDKVYIHEIKWLWDAIYDPVQVFHSYNGEKRRGIKMVFFNDVDVYIGRGEYCPPPPPAFFFLLHLCFAFPRKSERGTK